MAKRLILSLVALASLAACSSIWATPEEVEANRAAHAPAAHTQTAMPEPTRAPPPPMVASTRAPPLPEASAPVAAPSVSVPPPPAPRNANNEEVIVPGTVQRQVPVPSGDPRSTQERAADIHGWDQCVMHAMAHTSADPMRPQLESPEDICRRSLGMNNRNAVPDSRRP